MTRLMGDATHDAVATLAAVPGLQIVAGYDTGSPDIDWTDADWALFPQLGHIHIDQAFNTTVNIQAHVVVFDVEPGAYQPGDAASLIDLNTTARPTVYVNRVNLAATVASAQQSANWRGDVWLAFPGWQPGQPLPPLPPGCQYVAIQNQLDVANAYDLSVVLDPTWPEDPMAQVQLQQDVSYCKLCGCFYYGAGTASVCVGNPEAGAFGPHAPADPAKPQPFSILYAG